MSTGSENSGAQDKQDKYQSGQGVRIFTYPKIIFIFPTLLASLVCGLGMSLIGDQVEDPTDRRVRQVVAEADDAGAVATELPTADEAQIRRFTSTQNILSMLFLVIFAVNMLIMAIDFPRFTVFAGVLLCMMLAFFFLWLNAYYDLIPPLVGILEGIFAVANAQFYFLFATILLASFVLIYLTRWLDYWEILPNELLHHHGPMSDLERYPTFNLKFDKEIPDVLEYLFLGAGRLVLHVANEHRAIVLDNVLFITAKEVELKRLMSRMNVRVTTDKELGE